MNLPLEPMPRLVWMVLNDGRSVVAGCGSTTREGLERALAEPDHLLTLTSDDRVARSTVPAASSIYRLVHV